MPHVLVAASLGCKASLTVHYDRDSDLTFVANIICGRCQGCDLDDCERRRQGCIDLVESVATKAGALSSTIAAWFTLAMAQALKLSS
jgi:hypothetical protein